VSVYSTKLDITHIIDILPRTMLIVGPESSSNLG
jgi:hypothetical protein